jgi:hypothetical protein
VPQLLIAVRGQECGQRVQCLIGSLLGGVVAAARDDQGLHVVGGELHRVRDLFTQAVRSADAQHGYPQPPGLALLVLRDGGIQCAVDREASVQRGGVGGEGVDVVADGVIGQWPGGLGGELPAEVDVLPTGGELVVHLGEPVEREVPQRVVQVRVGEQGRGWGHPREGGLGHGQPGDPVRVVGGQRVADPHAGVVPGHGEPPMAQRVHQRGQVGGQGAGVVPVLGPAGQPGAALVGRDDLEVAGQRGHHQSPGVPGLRPAVH